MSASRTSLVATNAAQTPSALAGEVWGGGAGSPANSRDSTVVIAARTLRRTMTPAERKLWRALRELNASSATHFRNQAPIGPYIADFCEHTRKLVIEVDGGQHTETPGLIRDAKRTAWLESRGYRVIRFSNIDVLTKLEGVMISIMTAAGTLPTDASVVAWPPPTPTLPRKGGGSHAGLSLAQQQRPSHAVSGRKAILAAANLAAGDDAVSAPLSQLSADIDPIVPSPLAGEGQGGGDDTGADFKARRSIRPRKGIKP